MPRIRTLKPELWQDTAVGSLSHEARLLFVGLITQADDHGRQEGHLMLVRARIYPLDPDVHLDQIEQWLVELVDAGLVLRYEHRRSTYIALPGWKSHQKVNHPSKSKLPPPPREASRKPLEDSREPLELYPQDQGSRIKDQGGDQGEEMSPNGDVDLDAEWEEWLAHFREVTGRRTPGSKQARRFFNARRADKYSLEDLKLATIGCHSQDHLVAQGFDRPETILRDSNVGRYVELGREIGANNGAGDLDAFVGRAA